jgi:hypothetical protein
MSPRKSDKNSGNRYKRCMLADAGYVDRFVSRFIPMRVQVGTVLSLALGPAGRAILPFLIHRYGLSKSALL